MLPRTTRGFSLIELLVSAALILLMATLFIQATLAGEQGTVQAGVRVRAQFVAEEGLEATRSIRDGNFASLVNGTYGLSFGSGRWAFSGSSDTEDIFTRTVTITTIDATTKQASSTVSWPQGNGTSTVSLTTYLSNTDLLPAATTAGVLMPDISNAVLDSTAKHVQGITIQNTGSNSITLSKMKISWAPTGSGKLTQIWYGGTLVWSNAGPGSPATTQSSGATTTLSGVTLTPGAIGYMDFVFTNTMHSTAFTFVFAMSDNTQKTVTTATLP